MNVSKFEVFPSEGGWYFHLRAKNGEILCQSEAYGSQRDARRGARALRLAALTARTVEGTN
jgi:uncharacterized protein YegP (UPF0339 family)